MNDELLHLVDENDNVIGSHLRNSDTYLLKRNFRVVNAFIQNSKGELWIPRRAAHKKLFPLALDVSIGGHVTYGESYEDALIKEASEEVNLDLKNMSYEFLGHLNPHKYDLSAFMKVYLIKTDEAPNYNPNDFIEYYWLKPSDILKKIDDGDLAKGDLPKLVRIFFS
jgi:isopentenyl-diphosphate delta-isomerase